MSKNIVISDAVAKALDAKHMTADEILRDILKLDPDGIDVGGLVLPEGTFLRTWYKDRPYWGEVKRGAIVIQDKPYTSLSGAAMHVTHRPTNGFDFWEIKTPGGTWTLANILRSTPKRRSRAH